jgi:hypothetical protein
MRNSNITLFNERNDESYLNNIIKYWERIIIITDVENKYSISFKTNNKHYTVI